MNYPSIRIEGAILSPDILDGLYDDTIGQRPADFGLDSGSKVKDEIARAWADAQDYWRIFQRKVELAANGELRAEKNRGHSPLATPHSPLTTETRNLWMVPLLGLLGYQLEYQAKAVELNGKTYAISHRVVNRGNTPLHVIGYREAAGLDRKPERTHIGAPRMSAHGLLQEYLNLHDELYGLVTNGRMLRLLRDSSRLIKLTYLEFDLDRIFTDGLFADFAVLYRLLHATRLPVSHESASDSLIERYHQDSLDSGARIREGLSRAVEQAIRDFANGFLQHPHNDALRSQINTGKLTAEAYYSFLLHLIYRLLFLMVIEERGLVYPSNAQARHRDIYQQYYSLQRLRRLAEKRHLADQRHHDLWLSLLATFKLFESDSTAPKLGLAPLAGDLFNPQAIDILGQSSLGNDVLLGCFKRLSLYQHPDNGQTLRVNYAALNVEEFGSVYEGLLEYQPVFLMASSDWRAANGGRMASGGSASRNNPLAAHHSLLAEQSPLAPIEFVFKQGQARSATGSHYTPDELVQPLIKHSLDYLLADKLELARTASAGDWQTLEIEQRVIFEKEIYGILSGYGNLAAGDEFGRVRLHIDEMLSKGRIVWHDQPDSTRGSVHSGKHSRGVGKAFDKEISTVSADSERQPSGIGNASFAQSASRPLQDRSGTATVEGGSDDFGQTDAGPASLALTERQLAELWGTLPLAARYSLLATQALLSLRVADIACGSGHILLAAARRIATELAIVRTGEEQPSPTAFRAAIRDVIRQCIYGVDLNPLAVELCKVALWLEAHNPGEPLNFLDHHIKCGNAIVGFAKREELERGIPDEAFATQPGDEKDIAALFRKKNKDERNKEGQLLVFDPVIEQQLDAIVNRWRELSNLPEQTPAQIDSKKLRFQEFSQSQDAWTLAEIAAMPIAQFYIEKTNANKHKLITDAEYRRFLKGQQTPQGQAVAEAFAIGLKKRFFHWFLEFPEIMARGGFDCILGNPPYLGGKKLSGTFGDGFLSWVKYEFYPAGGLSDLVVYFVRRIGCILRPNGFFALITTNTISQGDSRAGGLQYLCDDGHSIVFARRSMKWPGQATLEVSLISVRSGNWNRTRFLEGRAVNSITWVCT